MPALIACASREFGPSARDVLGVAVAVLAAVLASANACTAEQSVGTENAIACTAEPATAAATDVEFGGAPASAPVTGRTAVPTPSSPANGPATREVVYSQFREEIHIRHFFDDEKGGVYLDVGAWRPEENSTTAYLDRELGWTGIAIDPQPGLADRWRRARPRAKFFSYFVGDRSGITLPFYLGHGVSSYDEEHVRSISKMGEERPGKIDVEMITLDDLLARERVESIDFMSMDIEGAEPRALAGFDIERYKPRLVCIEAGRPGSERRAAIAAYFEAHGYRRIIEYESPDDPNWYLTPRGTE